MRAKEARTMDTFIHYGIAAAVQAVPDAGLPVGRCAGRRSGHPHRLRDRLGHRRPADDRGHARGTDQPRPAAHLAVFRAGVDHQHDRRPCVDPFRLQGPQHRHRHGLHHRPALHRRGRSHDRVRRCRRHGRRRLGGDGVAAGHRRLCRHARACRPATTIRRRRRGRSTAIATVSCWARAPACWCSRNSTMRGPAAPRSMPNWPASA